MAFNTTSGKIYLIPIPLAPETHDKIVTRETVRLISQLNIYFVENVRTARRFISSLKTGKRIEDIRFIVLDKNTSQQEIYEHLEILERGEDVGVMSESGCPGIADPGAVAVALAHEKQIKVMPLAGPSSIVMALMASGFNGQQFTFHGYLPIDNSARKQKIKELEKEVFRSGYTQIFIETPYRNDKLVADLVQHLHSATKLCIAANITSDGEYIKTQSVAAWKKNRPAIGKVPAIFLIGQ